MPEFEKRLFDPCPCMNRAARCDCKHWSSLPVHLSRRLESWATQRLYHKLLSQTCVRLWIALSVLAGTFFCCTVQVQACKLLLHMCLGGDHPLMFCKHLPKSPFFHHTCICHFSYLSSSFHFSSALFFRCITRPSTFFSKCSSAHLLALCSPVLVHTLLHWSRMLIPFLLLLLKVRFTRAPCSCMKMCLLLRLVVLVTDSPVSLRGVFRAVCWIISHHCFILSILLVLSKDGCSLPSSSLV